MASHWARNLGVILDFSLAFKHESVSTVSSAFKESLESGHFLLPAVIAPSPPSSVAGIPTVAS